MVLTLIIFTIVNVVLAFIDAHKIIKGNTINHLLNAGIYVLIVAIPFLLFKNWFLVAALLFNRLLVFNIMLSLFRSLKWNYISPAPISVTDRIAKFVFGNNGTLMYGIYAVAFIILTVISFL